MTRVVRQDRLWDASSAAAPKPLPLPVGAVAGNGLKGGREVGRFEVDDPRLRRALVYALEPSEPVVLEVEPDTEFQAWAYDALVMQSARTTDTPSLARFEYWSRTTAGGTFHSSERPLRFTVSEDESVEVTAWYVAEGHGPPAVRVAAVLDLNGAPIHGDFVVAMTGDQEGHIDDDLTRQANAGLLVTKKGCRLDALDLFVAPTEVLKPDRWDFIWPPSVVPKGSAVVPRRSIAIAEGWSGTAIAVYKSTSLSRPDLPRTANGRWPSPDTD